MQHTKTLTYYYISMVLKGMIFTKQLDTLQTLVYLEVKKAQDC
ncbi:Uncharacterised protein [Sphingobacterium daejeonense]|nr:Uncharacterised protein [Sphingobacterium daejeonense]